MRHPDIDAWSRPPNVVGFGALERSSPWGYHGVGYLETLAPGHELWLVMGCNGHIAMIMNSDIMEPNNGYKVIKPIMNLPNLEIVKIHQSGKWFWDASWLWVYHNSQWWSGNQLRRCCSMKNQDVQLSVMKDDWLVVSHMFEFQLYLGWWSPMTNTVQMINQSIWQIFTKIILHIRVC